MDKKLFFILGFFLTIIYTIPLMACPPADTHILPDCAAEASFTANDTCEGYPIKFNNTTCGSCTNITFSWNFDDGSPAVADKNPEHLYLNAGTYLVTLVATWNGATPCSTIVRKTITIRPFQDCCPNTYLDPIFPDYGYIGDIISFSFNPVPRMHSGYDVFWAFGDNPAATYNEVNPTHIFKKSNPSPGYNIYVWATYKNEATGKECLVSNAADETNRTIQIYAHSYWGAEDCCDGSFAPEPGKKYVLSAWVRSYSPYIPTYTDGSISVVFTGVGEIAGPFYPKGPIIDDWQRIEEEFIVPLEATSITVNLNNEKDENVFFDDIRIFPTEGNMKSYVYDPLSKKLMAELDQNNYATYYEYNEEGELVRVKKETEKGRVTIKESRNSTLKTNQ